ncbi:MAG: glycolate oxidase subunit GlcE [Pseudomonadales bacterium]
MTDSDELERLVDGVREAHAAARPLEIRGAGTKSFLVTGKSEVGLDVTGHRGVISHQPTELTITARAGTPVRDIEELLGSHAQRLPFEPPFADRATIGGTVSAGISGPRRPWDGAVRDAVLGVTLVNGEGRHLRFGGEVMKNVAGYDVSRLVCGAYGVLGVLTSVSLKVLPQPEAERTLCFEIDRDEALARANAWARSPLPVSATYHHGERLRVRLSGTREGVASAARELGGAELADAATFWKHVRDQSVDDFRGDNLWRFSSAAAAPYPPFGDAWITEWAGALRWYLGELDQEAAFAEAKALGGHATRWHGGTALHQPLEPALVKLHRRLKDAFDPRGILNPGRVYPDI